MFKGKDRACVVLVRAAIVTLSYLRSLPRYANQNQLENAIKDFREALNVHPNHHNASKYLKETLFEKAIR